MTFEQSYQNFQNYPSNLLYKVPSSYTLDTIERRLANFDPPETLIEERDLPRVTCAEGDKPQVPYWDIRKRITSTGAPEDLPPANGQWLDDAQLEAYLRDAARVNVTPAFTKVDPQCRLLSVPKNKSNRQT